MPKVILAYSGSLATTCAIHYLRNKHNLRVITFSADLGQVESVEPLGDMAIAAGAEAFSTVDLREPFLTNYAFRALKAWARNESGYLLASALSRPLIAHELVDIARDEKTHHIAHGCSGMGNDQVRFETSLVALDPDVVIWAPTRLWPMKTTKDLFEYARRHRLPIPEHEEDDVPKSVDLNIWGASLESERIRDLSQEIPAGLYQMTTPPGAAPDAHQDVSIMFEKGAPVAVDGDRLPPVDLVQRLNLIGGTHGVGMIDAVEDRLIGIKVRELYEAPGASILYAALEALEDAAFTREVRMFRRHVSQRYAALVHEGRWFSCFREALDAFCNRALERATGTVKLRLFKGSIRCLERDSKYSLYDQDYYVEVGLAETGSVGGFMDIWKRPGILEARANRRARETRHLGIAKKLPGKRDKDGRPK